MFARNSRHSQKSINLFSIVLHYLNAKNASEAWTEYCWSTRCELPLYATMIQRKFVCDWELHYNMSVAIELGARLEIVCSFWNGKSNKAVFCKCVFCCWLCANAIVYKVWMSQPDYAIALLHFGPHRLHTFIHTLAHIWCAVCYYYVERHAETGDEWRAIWNREWPAAKCDRATRGGVRTTPVA